MIYLNKEIIKMNLVLIGRVNLSNYKLNSYNNFDLRLKDTRESFLEILSLKIFKKIIIADSSNVEIFSVNEIIQLQEKYEINIEQQIYHLDDVYDRNDGIKSSSELVNLVKVLKNTSLLTKEDSFYKITPRYNIENLKEIIKISSAFPNFYFDFHFIPFTKWKRIVVTSIFKEEVSFIKNLDIEKCLNFLDENNGVYIEHLFYELRIKYKRKYLCCPFPVINTIAGTSGKKSKMNYFKIRNIASIIGIMAFTNYSK